MPDLLVQIKNGNLVNPCTDLLVKVNKVFILVNSESTSKVIQCTDYQVFIEQSSHYF